MDAGSIVGLVITLAFSVVITVVVTAVSVIVPLVITGVVLWVVIKQLQSGQRAIVISGPLAQLAAGAAASAPKSRQLKKIVCSTCGGSKLVPPKTAYVYCDYCGSLVDWDFKIACSTAGSAKPGPAYEALLRTEGPKQAAARAAGDREAYADVTRRIFDAHFRACPGAWSPRLGDPDYRAALLENTVSNYTAAAFDHQCATLEARMNDSVKQLVWIPSFPQPRAEPTSFERLIDAVLAHNERFTGVAEPFLATHPDQPTLALQRRISRSAFAQGWMSYLDGPGQKKMIEKLDLGGEYVDVPTVETTIRHCAGCSKTLAVVPGAKKVVCEDCGHTSDVEKPEITCSGCGAPVSVLWAKRSFRCPACAIELRVD
jgi:DNA-directed RNA polymerase subunit RPC12/RpoP